MRSGREGGTIGRVDSGRLVRDDRGELVPWRVDSLVTPDYGSIGYRSYVSEVTAWWLDRGITGWRLDSLWSAPTPFWRAVLARVRETHPTAWFLGQVFDDDLPPVVNHTTVSSTTEYAPMHGIREWLSGGPTDEIVATLRVHRNNCSRTPPHTFLGNHDFTRLADAVPAALLPAAFLPADDPARDPRHLLRRRARGHVGLARGGSDAALRPPMMLADLQRTGGASQDLLTSVRQLGEFRRANRWLTSAVLTDVRMQRGALDYTAVGDGHSLRVYLNPTAAPLTLDADHASPIDIPARGWVIHLG